MERKSNGFLKVTGILMIIGGGIMLVLSLSVIYTAFAILSVFGIEFSLAHLSALLSLAGAAFTLTAGIIGVVNASKPEKAMICIVFGILSVCLTVIGTLSGMAEDEGGANVYTNLIFGLVVPVLYLIGAFKNKKRQSAIRANENGGI